MRKPDAPCKGCERRELRCHARCVEYAAYRDDNEVYKDMVYDIKAKNHALEAVSIRRSRRAKKAAGVKK